MTETVPVLFPWHLALADADGRRFDEALDDYRAWEEWMAAETSRIADTLGEAFRIPFAEMTEEQRIALRFIMGMACGFSVARGREIDWTME